MSQQEYIEVLKSAALSSGKKFVIDYVSKKIPFLFIPILNPITSLVIEKVVEVLIMETEFAIFFKYTDMRVSEQGKVFSKMAENNYKAQMYGTNKEKEIAEKLLVDSCRSLFRLNL